MIKLGLIDWVIACVSLAVCVLTAFYWREQELLLVTTSALAVLFAVLGFVNRDRGIAVKKQPAEAAAPGARQIVLLNDDGRELRRWDLYKRTSLVIGRDMGENQVDIDLSGATYAGFVAVEHAVLNYAGGNWHIEDLHSENGVSVQKRGDARQYRLAPAKPCRLDAGDIVHIAQTKLLVR